MATDLDEILEAISHLSDRIGTLKADVAAIEKRLAKHQLRLAVIPTNQEVAMIRKTVIELQRVVSEAIPEHHLKESPVEVEEPPGVNATLDNYSTSEDF